MALRMALWLFELDANITVTPADVYQVNVVMLPCYHLLIRTKQGSCFSDI